MATHAHTTPDRRPATPPGTGGRRRLAAGIAALALVAPAWASTGLQAAKASTNPDADLFQLYTDHARNHAAVNAMDAPDWEDEQNPLWLTYTASYKATRDSKPQTMAGVLAKARLAELEDCVPGADEDSRDWAGIVVRDLLALAGAA